MNRHEHRARGHRRLALPRSVRHWSPTTLREKVIKTGVKVVRHAKYVTFQTAEVAVPRELFAAILERTRRFGVPPPLVQREWPSASSETFMSSSVPGVDAARKRGQNRCPWGIRSRTDTWARPDRGESRHGRPFPLEFSGAYEYDRGLRSDKWAISVPDGEKARHP